MSVVALGTYLPPWGTPEVRTVGLDEDALTIAVDAGRAALAGADVDVHRVVLVTRDLPLLEGGNGAALVAGLGLTTGTEVVERVGGAPAALDALLAAASGTLVIGTDAGTGVGAGGAAAVVSDGDGLTLAPVARAQRSLPMRTRDREGRVHEYDDARLLRERGTRVVLDESGITGKAVAAVGLGARDAAALCEGGAPRVPTTGGSAPLFALADLTERRTVGLVLAFEQATMTAAELDAGSTRVERVEPEAQVPVSTSTPPGPDIKISLAAYDRAFDAKVRLEAGRCPHCTTLALPPRHRCLGCGAEGDAELVALPRDATVYTSTTVHTPVPGLATPYTIVIVELGDTGVRLLARVTGVPAGGVGIGDGGAMVLRRVAVRSGVPDYGYAFAPTRVEVTR